MNRLKKHRFILTGIFIIIIYLLTIVFLIYSNKQMVTRNNLKYETLIGSLISKYHVNEDEIHKLIFEAPLNKNTKIGKDFIVKYGYKDDTNIKSNKLNYNNIRHIIVLFTLGFLVSCITIFLCIHSLSKDLKHEFYDLTRSFDDFIIYGDSKIDISNKLSFFSKYEDRFIHVIERINLVVEDMNRERENTKELINQLNHQLKTPLSSLKIFHDILRKDNIDTSLRIDFINRCNNELDKVDYLMNIIVNISRLETDIIKLNKEHIDISNTIVKAVEDVYGKMYEKNIDIIFDNLISKRIYHDFNWTKEALINLLDNSIKYSKENTSIYIKTWIDDISYNISIEDSGVGIKKEELLKVFKKFYRGKNIYTNKVQGSGLGLFISKFIIEKQDGSIELISTENVGTRITVKFYFT